MKPANALADRIREALQRDPRNDAEIAEAVGIARPMISMYRHGTRAPSRESLRALAKVLNVEAGWLLEGEAVVKVGDQETAELVQMLLDAPPEVRAAIRTLLDR